ncbi:hypothetical protein [Streptomyces sp. NPDC019793]|uniref:hypothetical protein n=1 Tax=unclassified Streptomyces TaxID=2593676 RepID=UPI003405557D
MASALAAQQHAAVTLTDLRPFPDDDPRGAGFTAAALPMVIGGMIPAVALSRLFPGRTGLRRRLTGAFALVAGFAVTVVLHYGTGSLSGDYLATGLGVVLGLAALVMTLIGLESLLGMAGFGLGAVMFLGNPLSGLTTGPHWLPDGWATLGQLLPPGASGSLLRANAFFDGAGADTPILVLAGWTALGLTLTLRRRSARTPPRRPHGPEGSSPAPARLKRTAGRGKDTPSAMTDRWPKIFCRLMPLPRPRREGTNYEFEEQPCDRYPPSPLPGVAYRSK